MKTPSEYAAKAEELLQVAEEKAERIAQGVCVGAAYTEIARTYVDLAAVSASLIPIEDPE